MQSNDRAVSKKLHHCSSTVKRARKHRAYGSALNLSAALAWDIEKQGTYYNAVGWYNTQFNFRGSMHHDSILWIKPAWCSLLGIYCTLVSSACFGCYFHPSSGALVCTGGKVQYMCACSVSSGVEFQLSWISTPDDKLHAHIYCTSTFPPVLLKMDGSDIRNM